MEFLKAQKSFNDLITENLPSIFAIPDINSILSSINIETINDPLKFQQWKQVCTQFFMFANKFSSVVVLQFISE
jgi:hypothetical protein